MKIKNPFKNLFFNNVSWLFGLFLAGCLVCFIFWIGLNNSWPVYPKPPTYPNSLLVRKYEDPPGENRRFTEFRTVDTVDQVFAFYKEILPENGWQSVNATSSDSISFSYTKGGVNRPAYHLVVSAVKSDNGTFVTLQQNISGPFSWASNDW